MTMKPLELRVLTPEEREARERAIKTARTAAQTAVKLRPLKKTKN